MAAPIKITRPLAALLLRELPGFIAAAEKAGHAGPKLTLRYADGLTREDAQALYAWGQTVPELRQALNSPTHADHGAVRAYVEMTRYFTHDHPELAEGGPANWQEPLTPGLKAFIMGETDRVAAKDLSPAEAGAFLDFYRTRSDLVEAHLSGDAPLHETLMRELSELHAAASQEAAPSQPTQTEGAMPQASPQVQARIDELRSHPGYRDRSHGDHWRVVNELSDLLSQVPNGHTVAPQPLAAQATEAKPGTTTFAATDGERRAAELRAHPGYFDASHPDHARVVQEHFAALSGPADGGAAASGAGAG